MHAAIASTQRAGKLQLALLYPKLPIPCHALSVAQRAEQARRRRPAGTYEVHQDFRMYMENKVAKLREQMERDRRELGLTGEEGQVLTATPTGGRLARLPVMTDEHPFLRSGKRRIRRRVRARQRPHGALAPADTSAHAAALRHV